MFCWVEGFLGVEGLVSFPWLQVRSQVKFRCSQKMLQKLPTGQKFRALEVPLEANLRTMLKSKVFRKNEQQQAFFSKFWCYVGLGSWGKIHTGGHSTGVFEPARWPKASLARTVAKLFPTKSLPLVQLSIYNELKAEVKSCLKTWNCKEASTFFQLREKATKHNYAWRCSG